MSSHGTERVPSPSGRLCPANQLPGEVDTSARRWPINGGPLRFNIGPGSPTNGPAQAHSESLLTSGEWRVASCNSTKRRRHTTRIPKSVYTKEFHDEAVKLAMTDGVSVSEAARRLSISMKTLAN
jgi:hypothetical protein